MTHDETSEVDKDLSEENVDSSIGDESIKSLKRDRPLLSLLKQFVIVTGLSIAVIFIVGLVIGFSDARVPFLDSDVIANQWNNLTNGEAGASDWNELEKNP